MLRQRPVGHLILPFQGAMAAFYATGRCPVLLSGGLSALINQGTMNY
ncbi:MAG: hypothetical protein LBS01_02015 [Prevotellaceae bacterium]|nr:hypothetical protein [Prevotellaceae bacterium]